MTEYIYYAKKKGAPDYTEEIALEMSRPLSDREMERLTQALEGAGKEFIRVFEYNGEAPDFARTVKI